MDAAVLEPLQPSLQPDSPRIDKLKAYQLRVVNKLTYSQIGAIFGVSESAASQCLRKVEAIIGDPEVLQAQESVKTQLYQAAEHKLLASLLEPVKLEKASLNNVAYALTQVHMARRLEEGKSTENVNVLSKMIGRANEDLFGKTPPPVAKPSDDVA